MAITSRVKTTKAKLSQKNGSDIIKIAAIQMASGPQVSANLSEAERLIEIAVNQGAKLVVLPEYFAIMGLKDTDKIKVRETEGHGPIQDFLSKTAKQHKIWLIGGSIPLASSSPNKVRNSCLVYDDKGKQVARYDKIHLFGLDLGNEHYHEETTIEPGNAIKVVDTPFGKIGLSICYDLRFPSFTAPWAKSISLSCHPRLPTPPAKRTGKAWCAHARLRTYVTWLLRHRAATIFLAGKPMATA